jgi:hypothetical protein
MVRFPAGAGKRFFLFATVTRLTVGCINLLSSGYRGHFLVGKVTGAGHEADFSLPSIDYVKNNFMACCLIMGANLSLL